MMLKAFKTHIIKAVPHINKLKYMLFIVESVKSNQNVCKNKELYYIIYFKSCSKQLLNKSVFFNCTLSGKLNQILEMETK